MIACRLDALVPGSFSVVLGNQIANSLGVGVGDTVLVLAPQGSISPAGFTPRLRQFTVSGIFSSGCYEYDASLALLNYPDPPKGFSATRTRALRQRIPALQEPALVARQPTPAAPHLVSARDKAPNH